MRQLENRLRSEKRPKGAPKISREAGKENRVGTISSQ